MPGGSPPRVRGTVLCVFGLLLRNRITPACAGNSIFFIHPRYTLEDHPRVCGEQNNAFLNLNISGGSPPRVRGTVIRSHSFHAPFRITPACAGNR